MGMKSFQILSLSGGGYGGLYTAAILAKFEEHAKKPIGRCFELIAGTSIGGIIALAVGFEVPMSLVVEIFEKEGETLFPRRSGISGFAKLKNLCSDFRKPPYSLDQLKKIIGKILEPTLKLGDSKHPLVIPVVNLTQGKPQIFKTRHYADIFRDPLIAAVDIGAATAAAPTFFGPAKIDDCLYVDGGLVATSPDLVAFHEATHFLKQTVEDVGILSIGTTSTKYSVADDPKNSYGIKFWLSDDERRLPKVFLSAQQQFTQEIIQHRLGSSFMRIDCVPSPEQVRCLGLDVATSIARTTLLGLGKKDATDALGKSEIRELLARQSTNLLLKQ